MSLYISELRPHLGALNWALRRINKSVEVVTENHKVVVDVKIGSAGRWLVICGNTECGQCFDPPNTQSVYCPHCGHDNSAYVFE